MEKLYNRIQHKLGPQILDFEIGKDYSIPKIKAINKLIIRYLSEVKDLIITEGFKNEDEEIYFFKHQKPTIISKLIYYNILYKIGSKKSYGRKQIKKFLNKELNELKKFRKNNLDFYQYYKSNHTYRDKEYFLRDNNDVKSNPNDKHFWTDRTFSTSHDYKAAKILAYDLLLKYIGNAL